MAKTHTRLSGVMLALIGLAFLPTVGIHLALALSAILAAYLIVSSGWRIKAWHWACLGSAFWAIEEFAWAVSRLSGIGTYYLTDFFYFAGAAFWLIALLTLPKRSWPTRNLLLTFPVWGLIFYLLYQSLKLSFEPFILTDVVLFVGAIPLIESAFQSRAHEGRILLGFGFYVKALASTFYGWLGNDPNIGSSFFFLTLFAYLFIGLGGWLELKRSRGTLLSAVLTLVGLEAVVGTVLIMLYRTSSVSVSMFSVITAILGYLLFFGIMVLVVTDRQRKLRAEKRLKNYSMLLENLLALSTEGLASQDLLSKLFALLKPSFSQLHGLELDLEARVFQGKTLGYSFPLVSEGTQLGHLYFEEQPRNTDLLDALSPLLAAKLKNALAHFNSQTQAMTDPLTELLNRRGLEQKSHTFIAKARQEKVYLSVAIIDLDHFKRVNDSFGHDLGDQALVALANILKRTIRQHDLAVRWGGEEFLLLLYDCNSSVAQDVINRIRSELKRLSLPPISWSLTLSAGLSGGYVLTNDFDLSIWIQQADHALLAAKASGRDRIELVA